MTKHVKKLLKCRKKYRSLFISTGSEKYPSIYHKRKDANKAFVRLDEKQLMRDCKGCPKRLFQYIRSRNQRIGGILLRLPRSGFSKAEVLAEYFSILFSIDNSVRRKINSNDADLFMDIVVIEKESVLRLLRSLKRENFSSLDDIYFRTVKSLGDVIAELLAIGFYMSLWQSKLSRGGNG